MLLPTTTMTGMLTRRRCYNVVLLLLMIALSRSTAETDDMTATNSEHGSSMTNDDDKLSLNVESLRDTLTNRMMTPSFIDHLVKVDDEEDEEKNRSSTTTPASTIFANRNNINVSDDVDFDVALIDTNNDKELEGSSTMESSSNIHPRMAVDEGKHPLLPLVDEGNIVITIMVNNEDPMDDLFDDDDDDDNEYTTNTSLAQRNLQSCVKSATELKAAVKKAGSSSTQIRVCTSRIPLGSLNRRRRDLAEGGRKRRVAGGINLSNRSIIFTCVLKERCILDGEGISRIFYGRGAQVHVERFTFWNASAGDVDDAMGSSGSAMNFMGSSQITIQDCGFHYNTATNAGGAIMMNDSTLTLRSGRGGINFFRNRATNGGAIYGTNNATIQTMTRKKKKTTKRVLHEVGDDNGRHLAASSTSFVHFQDNGATEAGGAVHCTGGAILWDRARLQENNAASGGALMLIGVQTTITNVSVVRNKATVTGGAIVFQDGNSTIVNSTFISNDSNGTVGAITVISSTYSINPVNSINTTYRDSCWTDGSFCEDGSRCGYYYEGDCDLTCDYCCNGHYPWYDKYNPYKAFPLCGRQPCWDNGTGCIVGLSCSVCCNGWLGGDIFLTESQCGQDSCLAYGRACLKGTTCSTCCNSTYTYWYTKDTFACGIEPCLYDGYECVKGKSCKGCCNKATYWNRTADTRCGVQPCLYDGATCDVGTTCNTCCTNATYWYSTGYTHCGPEPCYEDGRICDDGGSCRACCNASTYWYSKASYACGSCSTNGTACGGATTDVEVSCDLCCSGSSSYWFSEGLTACGYESCWADGRMCRKKTTCHNCCNANSYWDSISSTACGTCWSDGRVCDAETTCQLCCNVSTYNDQYESDVCVTCFPNGTECIDGSTCDQCCDDSTYWYSLTTTACGEEPCYPDGVSCGTDWNSFPSCYKCCYGCTYWYGLATTACGPEGCLPDGTSCGIDLDSVPYCYCCSGSYAYWPTKLSIACGDAPS